MPPRETCLWYHTMDLPGVGEVKGYWDLRGHEADYLGGVQLSGRRVLEVGPASGALTFWMEQQGAEVVSLEAPADYKMDYVWDIPELEPPDMAKRVYTSQTGLACLHNSWWFAHGAHHSKVQIYYGSAYSIPPELGRFDIVTLAAVLLHNKSPHLILEQAARVAAEAVVVTEMMPVGEGRNSGHMIFIRENTDVYDGWFHLPPKLTVRMLATMGFSNSTITSHWQQMNGEKFEMYTVVARK